MLYVRLFAVYRYRYSSALFDRRVYLGFTYFVRRVFVFDVQVRGVAGREGLGVGGVVGVPIGTVGAI